MITTITIAGRTTAQGILTQRHADGRVTISTGTTEFTGYPVAKWLGRAAMVVLAALSIGFSSPAVRAESLLNVSSD